MSVYVIGCTVGSFIRTTLDILFPPSGEELLVRNTDEQQLMSLLRPHTKSHIISLASFGDERVAALIHEAKFHNNRRAVHLLGILLHTYVTKYDPDTHTIVPVPLSRARRRARGYNQVEEIIRAASKHSAFLVDTRTLRRVRDTVPQTSLDRKARIKNMDGAFAAKDTGALSKRHILLIDDVATTGTTLREAQKVLAACRPQSITCITLAG